MVARRVRLSFLYVLAIVITFINIAPLIWVFMSGFKTRLEVYTIPPVWIPGTLNLENYQAILDKRLPQLLNSLIVTVGSTASVLIIAIPAAFALTVFTWKRKSDLEFWILSTRMMPPIAAAIPLYLLIKGVNLYDSQIGLILLYVGFNLSFAIWMSSSFLRQVPKEIYEAALVDGCSWLQVLIRIMVPVAAGGISTVATFTALFCWNELLIALFMTSSNAKTFTVVLTEFQGQTNIVWEVMSAGAAIQIVPVVILTFLVQRYVVAGLTLGAVKE
ncbi:MAG: carbohydrate ABC transporter permease [Anaerolineae bacterium]|nr:carbohydrate ABC transporter permease [Anaerolineae bacterium]